MFDKTSDSNDSEKNILTKLSRPTLSKKVSPATDLIETLVNHSPLNLVDLGSFDHTVKLLNKSN